MVVDAVIAPHRIDPLFAGSKLKCLPFQSGGILAVRAGLEGRSNGRYLEPAIATLSFVEFNRFSIGKNTLGSNPVPI